MPHVDSHPVIVHPTGDLDLDAVETMVEALSRATRVTDEIVIDLTDVTYLDSVGVNVLAHAVNRGASIVVDPSSDVMLVVQSWGLLEPAF